MLCNTLCSREKTWPFLRHHSGEVEFRWLLMVTLGRDIWLVMTRLQNAKKQLNESLAALESAASNAISGLHQAGVAATPSHLGGQPRASVDSSKLIDEISIIEAKLDEAIAMIAAAEPAPTKSSSITDGDTE